MEPVTLIYTGWTPQANALLKAIGWRLKKRLRERALATFGILPPLHRATQPACVQVLRVLGPRQRLLDVDGLAIICKPILDAAVLGGHLVDDREKWAKITYRQDSERRNEGPRIEISIRYVTA